MSVINLGVETFHESLVAQGCPAVHVDWKPPAWGDPELARALDVLVSREEIDAANAVALDRLQSAEAILVDIRRAGEVIPGMKPNLLLHAGPPVDWEHMCGPMRGAVMGALIYEGLARDPEEAARVASGGRVEYSPCHEHSAVGPMAGIISARMPVFVVRNATHGNEAYCTINEGLGKVLRYGAYGDDVIRRLRWIEENLAPALAQALRISGGINVRNLMAQAIHMGDECHNRNRAGTSLLLREVIPHLLAAEVDSRTAAEVVRFMHGNDHFFLNLTMPACKVGLDAAHGVEYSTLVTAMARNGTEFGLRVSGLGDQWFTGPAQEVDGLYFPGFSREDANPDIGDSTITETAGLGGFAMAAAPAIVQFVGGNVSDAYRRTEAMYEITLGENRHFTVPALDFRGTPTGIDIRKVVRASLLPSINTGIAHRQPGVGQVGAGLVSPPREPFTKALVAMARQFGYVAR